MRGPYERVKYDFRRTFECPVCHHRERVEGPATWRVCQCQAKVDPRQQRPMCLVEEAGRRVTELPPRSTPAEVPSVPPESVLAAETPPEPALPAAPPESIAAPPETQA